MHVLRLKQNRIQYLEYTIKLSIFPRKFVTLRSEITDVIRFVKYSRHTLDAVHYYQ